MENNDNQYILQWREHVLKAAEALKSQDYDAYETEMEEVNNAYEALRHDESLSYDNEDSFGVANEIFESALPTLFIKNQQAVREFMKTVREDKNLISQFMFYETLKECKEGYNVKDYLKEAIQLVAPKLDMATVKESNQKAFAVLRKYNIKPSQPLNEDNVNFYRLCNVIFTSPKSLTNLSKLNEAFNKMAAYVESHAKVITENVDYSLMTLQEFSEKYNVILTEQEKEFLSTLLQPNRESERKNLYEAQRQECMRHIEKLLTESDAQTSSRLNSLLNSIQNKEYNKETILEDIVKIMEINDILNAE